MFDIARESISPTGINKNILILGGRAHHPLEIFLNNFFELAYYKMLTAEPCVVVSTFNPWETKTGRATQ